MSKVTQSTIARIHGVSRQAVGSALGLYTNSNIKLSAKVRESIIATTHYPPFTFRMKPYGG